MAKIMNIPTELYELLPSDKECLQSVDRRLSLIDGHKVKNVYPNEIGKPLTPRTVFRFQVYLQVVLHRVHDLSNSIINCVKNKQVASAFILLRALNENTSVIYDANRRLDVLISSGDFKSIFKLIFNLQYGTRIPDRIDEAVEDEGKKCEEATSKYSDNDVREAFTAQQILNVLDRISKDIPAHRGIYEYLCEYAHPNYDGLMGLYTKWIDKFSVEISTDISYTEHTVSRIFVSLDIFLGMFIEGHNGIVNKYPEIKTLSIEDLKQQGEDISAYE
ncbi:MAG: hypothetical protein KKA84_07015 [Bacteroidetes bacterium]|nr:hypothetical protein [Bacteroidota bacterium]